MEKAIHLFEALGVELEYMLVDRDTLNVRPIADQLLSQLAGQPGVSDFESGPITWSNELALHVVELKTTQPARDGANLVGIFERAIRDLQPTLDELGIRLLPTAMHPWMNPALESALWPHENREIYEAYDRIFGCREHGWANVQSVHLNLPFQGDEEFARLHAAVRLALPLLPALAASSPIFDGRNSDSLDSRLKFYAEHCRAVPSLTGPLIPEAIFDEATYRREVFSQIAADIGPLDTERVLQVDFLNARGAIARFDRGSIELRVMDVQECPAMDLAICAAATAVIRSLVEEQWVDLASQQAVCTETLRESLLATADHAEATVFSDPVYLQALGFSGSSCLASEVWTHLIERVRNTDPTLDPHLESIALILEKGTLATRIRNSLGTRFSRTDLLSIYRRLADCLETGQPFLP